MGCGQGHGCRGRFCPLWAAAAALGLRGALGLGAGAAWAERGHARELGRAGSWAVRAGWAGARRAWELGRGEGKGAGMVGLNARGGPCVGARAAGPKAKEGSSREGSDFLFC